LGCFSRAQPNRLSRAQQIYFPAGYLRLCTSFSLSIYLFIQNRVGRPSI
jgi:hypothetical protein